MEDDLAMREVKLVVLLEALHPLACVPKPRPPHPPGTSVQRVEFVKNMQAYLASQGPRVKAPPIRKIVQIPNDRATGVIRSPKEATDVVRPATLANLVLHSMERRTNSDHL